MDKEIKHIILIGSMKCGTTTLYDHLIKHPKIAKGITKEPEYFSIKMGTPELKKGKYLNKFKIEKDKHEFTLDASTGYTKFPVEDGVPERIKNYGIEPYFIYIVRNPLERIRSHYNFMKSNLSWKGKINSPHLINVSKYYMQLEQYTNFFPKEKILVVDFENLKKDPITLCNQIFNFIRTTEFNIDIGTDSVKNKTKPKNRKNIYITKKIEFFAKYTPSFINRFVKSIIKGIFPPKQKLLSDREKKQITELLKDDMIKLKNEFNINTEKWMLKLL